MTNPVKTVSVSDKPIRYTSGSKNSSAKLQELHFDPIERLVDTYMKLESEIERYEKLRSGELRELMPSGKVRYYNEDSHMAVYDRLIKISEQLLRYRYGRVPEGDANERMKQAGALVIQLTKKDGVHQINAGPSTSAASESMPDLEHVED